MLLRKITTKNLVYLYRNIGALLSLGQSFEQAVEQLVDEEQNSRLQTKLQSVADKLAKKNGYKEALAGAVDVFPEHVAIFLEKEISSKILAEFFYTMAEEKEKESFLTDRIKAALLYPFLLLIAAFALFGFITIFLVPVIDYMYSDFGQDLPVLTHILLDYKPYMTAAFLLGIIGLSILVFGMSGNRSFGYHFISSLPVIGTKIKEVSAATFIRSLYLLLKSGVDLPEAARMAAASVRHRQVRSDLKRVAGQTSTSNDLQKGLKEMSYFPSLVPKVVGISSAHGELQDGLLEISRLMDSVNFNTPLVFAQWLNILVYLFVSCIIGFLVIATYSPIFMLAGAV